MRALIWIVVLFAMAVGFTLAGKYDPGYAVLVYPPYRVELSLTLMVAVFLVLLVFGHLFFRLVSVSLNLPEQVRASHARQREQKSREALSQALTVLLEMRYQQAEKRAAEALALDPTQWQAALIAARAAHAAKAYTRRDAYLAQLEQLAPGQAMVRLVTEADCLLDEGRAEAAEKCLKQAALLDPKHDALQKMQLRAQQMLQNPDRASP
ncbi:MAG: heme biosynthesis HemY N-terminal domain-containing protein [Sulfuriferula sp.]